MRARTFDTRKHNAGALISGIAATVGPGRGDGDADCRSVPRLDRQQPSRCPQVLENARRDGRRRDEVAVDNYVASVVLLVQSQRVARRDRDPRAEHLVLRHRVVNNGV